MMQGCEKEQQNYPLVFPQKRSPYLGPEVFVFSHEMAVGQKPKIVFLRMESITYNFVYSKKPTWDVHQGTD